ncbi:hypothetical protein LINGRAHAP2_LOCUS34893 [Linum grandiflorum]
MQVLIVEATRDLVALSEIGREGCSCCFKKRGGSMADRYCRRESSDPWDPAGFGQQN